MKQNRKRSERRPVKRLCPTPETGLTEEQAAQRRAAGWNNAAQDSLSKTEWQIVRDNVFTFFNFVFVALAACLFAVGAYRDMMFLGIVAANVFIGIVQELRVKRTLDKVTLLSGSTACVVRGGRTRTVPTDELVLDDIVLLRPRAARRKRICGRTRGRCDDHAVALVMVDQNVVAENLYIDRLRDAAF